MGFLAEVKAKNDQLQMKKFIEDKAIYEKGLADSANMITAELAARLPQTNVPVGPANVGDGFGQVQTPAGLAQASIGGMLWYDLEKTISEVNGKMKLFKRGMEVVENLESVKLILNGAMIGLATVLSYLGLDQEVFTIFGYLLLIDYLSGIMKAKAIGQDITSSKMKYGVASKMSLMLIPLVLALTAKAVHGNADNVLYVGMNILILSEAYSIIGNIYTIRTKETLPEWDAVAALGHKIRSILIKLSGDADNSKPNKDK